ncbi:MAG TPA: LysR family transcriptional regulator [Opitutales bacterium]|nr:LysR family transcriptional regulator [Opitutales bacterium]
MKKMPKLEIEPRFRVSFGRNFSFGPGKAELLEHIQKTGSITDAAKAMGMSYMRAWMLIKSINRAQPSPLVQTTRGGRTRGGAKLSAEGIALLHYYRQLENRSLSATRPAQKRLQKLLSSSQNLKK